VLILRVIAWVLGKDKQLGSVSVGKAADLILVDGDPLEDMSTLRRL
jgi:imidazolonepropionase-like amidohydrolase